MGASESTESGDNQSDVVLVTESKEAYDAEKMKETFKAKHKKNWL